MTPEHIDQQITYHQHQLEHQLEYHASQLAWWAKHRTALENADLPIFSFVRASWIDFDFLNREDTLRVIRFFGGKWKKSVSGTKFNYDLELAEPVFDIIRRVRIYGGTPPPSCRIVEVEEVVPAQPEHTILVKKVQCTPTAESGAPESAAQDEVTAAELEEMAATPTT